MGIELKPEDQAKAYNQITSDFKNGRYSNIVMPTGCGKTYIALKLIEDNPDKRITYVSPSPVINAQVKSILKQEYGENWRKQFPNLKFATYNELGKQNEEVIDSLECDKLILDEIHRAGAKVWGQGVKKLLDKNKNAKVLGMTATPVRTDGRDMTYEIGDGISYELTLTEAVAMGTLPVPTYICSDFIFPEDITRMEEMINNIEDDEKRQQYKQRIEKCKKHIESADGISEILEKYIKNKNGKILIFCKDIEDIEAKSQQLKKWFSNVNQNLTIYKVSSANEKKENVEELAAFRKNSDDSFKVILAVNMLNEGFRDKNLTMEILTRPTGSEILFRQQIGRVLKSNDNENPIIFDFANNLKYFENFRREVIEIIQNEIANGQEENGYNEEVIEKFKIVEENIKFIEEFKKIENELKEYIKGRTVLAKFVEIAEILYAEGVEIGKLRMYKERKINDNKVSMTLNDHISRGNISAEILQKYNLDGEYPIGYYMDLARRAYNGTSRNSISKAEKEKLEKMEIVKEESQMQKFIRIAKALKTRKVNVGELQQSMVVEGKQVKTTLKLLVEKGCISQNIIDELELDEEYQIGHYINSARQAYLGLNTEKQIRISPEERDELENLEIFKKEEQKSKVAELIDILNILKDDAKINIQGIQQNIRKDGKRVYTTLTDLIQQGIITKEFMMQHQLDPEYKIGYYIFIAKQAYMGHTKNAITDGEKQELEDLEIIGELTKKEAKQSQLLMERDKAKDLYKQTQSKDDFTKK